MFFHLQYIHLFRPFLKYNPSASPLPSHVSPRRICSANAGAISKLMRLYKKTYNLRQICNIAVYMVHSACTIHMLNLPEKTAKRDIIHGVRHLEEIAEDWPCARRSLSIISVLARKWSVEIPEEALMVLQRTDEKYGTFSTFDVPSPNRTALSVAASHSPQGSVNSPQTGQEHYSPLNQYSQPTPPQIPSEIRPGSISPDLLNSLAMAGQMSNQIPPVTTSGGISINDNLPVTSWPSMPQRQQPMNNFTQAFTPLTSMDASRSGTRQVSPSSLYAIDGQDWYLKDGVNWQQNFEAWNLGGAVSSPGGSAGNGGLVDGSMFMFRGLRGGDLSDGAFDSLNMSMSNLDHLPGLD